MIERSFLAKENIQNIYPLTPMQEGMYFHALNDASSSAYFEQLVYQLRGELDVALLKQSFCKLFERYDILRTVFVQKTHEKPLQVILRKIEPDFRYLKERRLEDRKAFVEKLQRQDREQKFDLGGDVLMRLTVVEFSDDEFALVWSYHHILLDGWCTNVLVSEFNHIYESLKKGLPTNLPAVKPFYFFVRWLEAADKKNAADYWRNYLLDYHQCSSVPRKKLKAVEASYVNTKRQFRLEPALAEKINALIASNGITLNTFIQAVWGILLSKYNDTRDVVFGAVVSGRPAELDGVETMIGLFINTIPIRVTTADTTPFSEVLTTLHKHSIDGLPHHHYPLADIQAGSALGRGLIDHILVFGNYPRSVEHIAADSPNERENTSWSIEGMDSFEQTNYEFNVSVTVTNSIWIDFSFNSTVIEPAFVENMVEHFQWIVNQVLIQPDIWMKDICLARPEAHEKLIGLSAGPAREFDDISVVSLFEKQAFSNANAIALVADSVSLSYQEVQERSNQFANYLRRVKHVQDGDCVALLLGRNEWLPVVLLAVMKAGCTYIALDEEYPRRRHLHMLEETGCKMIVSLEPETRLQFPAHDVISIGVEWSVISTCDKMSTSYSETPVAYIIYSSGSTGIPKGVSISNHSLSHYVQAFINYFSIRCTDRVVCQSSVSFDTLVEEIYPALCAGARVVMAAEGGRDAQRLAAVIQREQVTVISTPPLVINELGRNYPSSFQTIRHAISGGDVLKKAYIIDIPDAVNIYNTYGPSEATVCATYAKIENKEDSEIIGRPLCNHSIYVMNEDMQLQPEGVLGEIFIAGPGVGLGYVSNKELTDRQFLADPFVAGRRMYRTGDLGRWNIHGMLEFAGRKDRQLKVRGYRIEPAEVEKVIAECEGVNNVMVLMRRDFLVAFYSGGAVEAVLRDHVGGRLPNYMVPALWLQLNEFPVTINGKIDRDALPDVTTNVNAGRDPSTETEKALLSIWKEVLRRPNLTIHDDFFVSGGHSLKATKLLVQIYKRFNVELKLSDIFNHPNIDALGKRIDEVNATMPLVLS